MALAAVLESRSRRGNATVCIARLTFSGTYPTNGEVLGAAALCGFPASRLRDVKVAGKNGFLYTYDKANDKVRVMTNTAGGVNGELTEHTNAAYVANVSGDTEILAEITFGI